MLLAIDVGNTNTVFALYREREPVGQWRLSTDRERTSDGYAAALIQLMALKGREPGEVAAVAISSVVPQAVDPLRRMAATYFGCFGFVVGEDVAAVIDVDIYSPGEAGADRLVNAVAAHRRYGGDLIIVDFGTATTFDLVTADGTYRGGVIAPGINLSLESLARAAAKLPRIAVARPARVVGRSTVPAMQSGIYWGYVGLIEGLIVRIRAEHGKPTKVIATGGLASLFASGTELIDHVDPDLTMFGLVEIYGDNRERMRRDTK
jgi:type III pantothenate kinase